MAWVSRNKGSQNQSVIIRIQTEIFYPDFLGPEIGPAKTVAVVRKLVLNTSSCLRPSEPVFSHVGFLWPSYIQWIIIAVLELGVCSGPEGLHVWRWN